MGDFGPTVMNEPLRLQHTKQEGTGAAAPAASTSAPASEASAKAAPKKTPKPRTDGDGAVPKRKILASLQSWGEPFNTT